MNKITQSITLDLIEISHNVINAMQGDRLTRNLVITITDNGKPYQIETSAYVYLRGKRADGKSVFYNATVKDFQNGIIELDIHDYLLSSSGRAKLDIGIYNRVQKESPNKEDEIASTESFELYIPPNIFNEDDVVNSDEASALSQLINSARDEIAEMISNAEQATKRANDATDDLENKLENHHFVLTEDKDAADGVPSLDENAKVPINELYEATTSSKGITQLVDDVNSDSTNTAATPNSVKMVNDALLSETARAKEAEKEISDDFSTHNASSTAHQDIRTIIDDLTTRLNALADSDDTTLDQLSEIVSYIKSNRTLIENVTTNKVNVADVIDNLTATDKNKPLSANQGKVLKGLIDALQEAVDRIRDMTGSTADAKGEHGLVPAPPQSSVSLFLKNDGSWGIPDSSPSVKVDSIVLDSFTLTKNILTSSSPNKTITKRVPLKTATDYTLFFNGAKLTDIPAGLASWGYEITVRLIDSSSGADVQASQITKEKVTDITSSTYQVSKNFPFSTTDVLKPSLEIQFCWSGKLKDKKEIADGSYSKNNVTVSGMGSSFTWGKWLNLSEGFTLDVTGLSWNHLTLAYESNSPSAADGVIYPVLLYNNDTTSNSKCGFDITRIGNIITIHYRYYPSDATGNEFKFFFDDSYNTVVASVQVPDFTRTVTPYYLSLRYTTTETFSGSYNDLTDKPTLFSGSYNDLTDKPEPLYYDQWRGAKRGISLYYYEGNPTDEYHLPISYCEVLVMKHTNNRGVAIAIPWNDYNDGQMYICRLHNDTTANGWGSWNSIAKGHKHDDRYYTESEINTKINALAPASHTHSYLPLTGGNVDGTITTFALVSKSGLELCHPASTPFIDFHHSTNATSSDYTSRIIEESSGTLTFYNNIKVGNDARINGNLYPKREIIIRNNYGIGSDYDGVCGSALVFHSCANGIYPGIVEQGATVSRDCGTRLGSPAYAFNHIYTYSIEQKSDRKKKKDIKLLSSEDEISKISQLFDKIGFVKYRFKENNNNALETPPSKRFHYGVIAQDVEASMEELGFSNYDNGLIHAEFFLSNMSGCYITGGYRCAKEKYDYSDNVYNYKHGLDYEVFNEIIEKPISEINANDIYKCRQEIQYILIQDISKVRREGKQPPLTINSITLIDNEGNYVPVKLSTEGAVSCYDPDTPITQNGGSKGTVNPDGSLTVEFLDMWSSYMIKIADDDNCFNIYDYKSIIADIDFIGEYKIYLIPKGTYQNCNFWNDHIRTDKIVYDYSFNYQEMTNMSLAVLQDTRKEFKEYKERTEDKVSKLELEIQELKEMVKINRRDE